MNNSINTKQELENLDSQWCIEQKKHYVSFVRGKGLPTRISAIGGFIASFFLIMIGVFMLLRAISHPSISTSITSITFIIIAGIAFVLSLKTLGKANLYHLAKNKYLNKRKQILRID